MVSNVRPPQRCITITSRWGEGIEAKAAVTARASMRVSICSISLSNQFCWQAKVSRRRLRSRLRCHCSSWFRVTRTSQDMGSSGSRGCVASAMKASCTASSAGPPIERAIKSNRSAQASQVSASVVASITDRIVLEDGQEGWLPEGNQPQGCHGDRAVSILRVKFSKKGREFVGQRPQTRTMDFQVRRSFVIPWLATDLEVHRTARDGLGSPSYGLRRTWKSIVRLATDLEVHRTARDGLGSPSYGLRRTWKSIVRLATDLEVHRTACDGLGSPSYGLRRTWKSIVRHATDLEVHRTVAYLSLPRMAPRRRPR